MPDTEEELSFPVDRCAPHAEVRKYDGSGSMSP
jgi:hypothetical protein